MIHVFSILFIVFMIGCVAFFAGIETGLFSVSKPKIKNKAAKGDRRAQIIANLLDNPDYFIGTALVGINIAHVTLAVVVAWYFNTIFANPTVSALLTTVLITPLLLLFGEILPKTICRLRPHATTLASAHAFQVVYRVLHPVTTAVLAVAHTVVPGSRHSAKMDPQLRRDEILGLVRHGEETGVVEDDEKEMIEAALELSETAVKEVMVPRVATAAIYEDMSYKEIVAYVLAQGYTRYPVYRETPDHVVGILHLTDLLATHSLDASRLLPPLYIPDSATVDDALEKMRAEGRHLAIVVDEYGGTAGIVTIEDLLEELVGEIEDEFDDSQANIIKIADNRWKVLGTTDIDEVIELLNLKVDSDEIEAETVGGMVTEKLGRIPKPGERLEIGGFTVLVTASDDRHVSTLEFVSR